VTGDTTDIALFVITSREDIVNWDRRKIIDALLDETLVDHETAEAISREVEKQIVSSGMSLLTSSLVRELVNARLIERRLTEATKMHARLGIPVHDVEQIVIFRNRENANVPHTPEGTNLTLAERIKKEFAVVRVFSQEVGYAHMAGDIHVHNLGYIDRPYCTVQNLDYIKKFGLRLPNTLACASPAKHGEVLISHMMRFSAALQGSLSGAVIWDAVNLLFAPCLEGLEEREILQLAQMLVYEFAQQAVARGGQTIFTDIHLYGYVPRHLEGVPAVGPGGAATGKTYEDYLVPARKFARAILDVFRAGDARGCPFVFPRPVIHLSDRFFRTEGHEEFLLHACAVASEMGNPLFAFDRGGEVNFSECGRLPGGETTAAGEGAWTLRRGVVQNISINLPRLGYRAGGDDSFLFSLLSDVLRLVTQAHVQKKVFMDRLLALGGEGPLSLLDMRLDGRPFLDLDRCLYLFGMVGLNELVQIHRGAALHDSEKARKFGMEVLSWMAKEVREAATRNGMRFALVQSPAETTAYRFARLDLKHFSPLSGRYVKGDISTGAVYYTNSTCTDGAAALAPMDRVRFEGAFHPLMEGGAMIQLWPGESIPPPGSVAAFLKDVFENTECRLLGFSPEFTTCPSCGGTVRGLHDRCPGCGSDKVEGIARITGYFSEISSWNKGKISELRDRKRNGAFSPPGGK